MRTDDIFVSQDGTEELLLVRGLSIVFYNAGRFVHAVKDVGFQVDINQSVALIGMSGSGKTISSLSAFGLVTAMPGVVHGEAWFAGENLLDGVQQAVAFKDFGNRIRSLRKDLDWERAFRARAGRHLGERVGFVFQEPVQALDPCYTVGRQLMEMYHHYAGIADKKQARDRALFDLASTDITKPQKVFDAYPHELSGGMCQRIVILLALVGDPPLVIADEPTTALDVITQQEILNLLFQEKQRRRLSILFITHDVRLLKEKFDKIAVLCRGYLVEWGSRKDYFGETTPFNHPYTRALLGNHVAQLESDGALRQSSFKEIEHPDACPYYDACKLRDNQCLVLPGFQEAGTDHFVRCAHTI